jgi:phosphoenolpyruvate carboxykinase (GTP)
VESPIGLMPYYEDLDLRGMTCSHETYGKLMSVDCNEALAETEGQKQFLAQFAASGKLPEELQMERNMLVKRLERSPARWEIPHK